MKWTAYMKRFWNFVWKEDSLLSWAVSIALSFIIIKFLVYPGLGLILGTNLPVVAVISESMEHNGDFDSWWISQATCPYGRCTQEKWYAEKHITKEDFFGFPMHNGFDKGDIILLREVDYETLQIGEVIVFQSGLAYPIIHRVVEKDDFIATKGDHNTKQITDSKLNEKYITKDQLIGRAWLRIRWLGYIKIWFVDLVRCLTLQGCSFY
jgi:signal peptidase I